MNQPQRRQSIESCLAPCSSIDSALLCTTGSCVCPILNSAGSSAVVTCANCLEGVDPPYANELALLANVCSKCSDQCAGVLTGIIQTASSCTTTACECSLFSQVGAASIETCASCVQSFDPTDASTLLDTEQACGIGVASSPASPPASPPASLPASPPASPASPPSSPMTETVVTSSAIIPPTVQTISPLIASTTSSQSFEIVTQTTSMVPTTANHSSAHRSTPAIFWWRLFRVGIIFEVLAFSFFQA